MPSFGSHGPGKRGRSSYTSDSEKFVIFGGLRQWQGFSSVNSLTNFWNDTTVYPFGG